eukprot:5863996-Pyramimonas_sp.AAC.1
MFRLRVDTALTQQLVLASGTFPTEFSRVTSGRIMQMGTARWTLWLKQSPKSAFLEPAASQALRADRGSSCARSLRCTDMDHGPI